MPTATNNDLQNLIGGDPFDGGTGTTGGSKGKAKGKAKPHGTNVLPQGFGGFLDSARHDVAAAADSVGHAVDVAGEDAAHDKLPWNGNPLDIKPLSGDDGSSATPAPKKAAAPAAPAASSGATPPASAAEQLLDGLAAQYQQTQAVVDPYISGSNWSGNLAESDAIAQGVTGVAASPSTEQTAASAILGKDAQSYAAANDAGAQGITTALKDTGLADQEYLSVSPYLGLLNALTSEAQYKTETGTPTFSIAGTPKWLQNAYQQTIGQTAAGTTTPGVTPQVSTGSTPDTSPTSDNSDPIGTS